MSKLSEKKATTYATDAAKRLFDARARANNWTPEERAAAGIYLTEERLRVVLALAYQAGHAAGAVNPSLDEALNMGDGSYRP